MKISFDTETESVEDLKGILEIINKSLNKRNSAFETKVQDIKTNLPEIKNQIFETISEQVENKPISMETENSVIKSAEINTSQNPNVEIEDIRSIIPEIKRMISSPESQPVQLMVQEVPKMEAYPNSIDNSYQQPAQPQVQQPQMISQKVDISLPSNMRKTSITNYESRSGQSALPKYQRPATVDMGALSMSDGARKPVSSSASRSFSSSNDDNPYGLRLSSQPQKSLGMSSQGAQTSSNPVVTNREKIKNLVVGLKRASNGQPIKMDEVLRKANSMNIGESEARNYVYSLKDRGEI